MYHRDTDASVCIPESVARRVTHLSPSPSPFRFYARAPEGGTFTRRPTSDPTSALPSPANLESRTRERKGSGDVQSRLCDLFFRAFKLARARVINAFALRRAAAEADFIFAAV